MGQALFLLALLSYCSGIRSEATVTQPASASVSLGQTVKLSCTGSSDGDWYTFNWYQQKPVQPPRFVHCGACSNKGEGIPDRFTASESGNTGFLTITNAQAEDEADYYCAAWDDTSDMIIFGGGTRLTVTGQPSVSPKVHLFPPSQEEIKSKNKATLVCLIDGFYPATLEVNWQGDGKAISSGVKTTQPTKQGDKYVATSYLTLSEPEWARHNLYTCKVTHDGKTFEEVVKKSECP